MPASLIAIMFVNKKLGFYDQRYDKEACENQETITINYAYDR